MNDEQAYFEQFTGDLKEQATTISSIEDLRRFQREMTDKWRQEHGLAPRDWNAVELELERIADD